MRSAVTTTESGPAMAVGATGTQDRASTSLPATFGASNFSAVFLGLASRGSAGAILAHGGDALHSAALKTLGDVRSLVGTMNAMLRSTGEPGTATHPAELVKQEGTRLYWQVHAMGSDITGRISSLPAATQSSIDAKRLSIEKVAPDPALHGMKPIDPASILRHDVAKNFNAALNRLELAIGDESVGVQMLTHTRNYLVGAAAALGVIAELTTKAGSQFDRPLFSTQQVESYFASWFTPSRRELKEGTNVELHMNLGDDKRAPIDAMTFLMLQQLALNAQTAMRSTERTPGSPPRQLFLDRTINDGLPEFTVRDTGPGIRDRNGTPIPGASMLKIFGDFSTNSQVGNEGLGLQLVRLAAQRIGATVSVSSTVGDTTNSCTLYRFETASENDLPANGAAAGTTFRIRLEDWDIGANTIVRPNASATVPGTDSRLTF